MRFGRRLVVFGLAGSLVAGLLLGLPPVAVMAAAPEGDASSDRSVPVWPAASRPASTPEMPAWRGSVPVWPSAGSQVVAPVAAASGVDSMVSATGAPGGLPVTVRAMGGPESSELSEADEQRMLRRRAIAPAKTSVLVDVRDRGFARRAGVSGVVLAVSPAATLARTTEMEVSVDYSGFRSAYGGDWASRLRLVRLPACVLTTPEVADCQVQTPIAGSRQQPSQSLVSAPVTLGMAAAEPSPSGVADARGALGGVVLALTASGSSENGTWEATSLNPSTSWAAGASGGDFTYSVPLTVPEVPGGLMPADSVTTLRYSSGSVDGLTKSTSTQASWVGEGFADTTPGFVERSYKSCADDGRPASNAGDWCWSGYNPITVVLGGRSTRILWDAATGWKTEDDSAGWKLESLTGAANGVHNGEHWKITTGDGTQHFFGSRPRWDNGGALRALVYSNNSGEPCYQATFANAQCWMGYRWNLDYVIDRHGNTINYRWGLFSNKYGANNNTSAQEYDAFGWLHEVWYGANTVAGAGPSAKIEYAAGYRCLYTQVQCDTAGNDWMWPDAPRDKLCALWLTSCPDNKSQTFFSLYRLAKVTTRVWDSVAGVWSSPVDEVTLTHEFPATGDFVPPAGDDTSPSLWLRLIDRTGWPQMRFDGVGRHNRVHWSTSNGLAPMHHYRVNLITTGLGEQIEVNYSNTDCSSTSFPGGQADNNTRLCFPQYLSLGNDSGWSWFHKYRADGVWSHDLTGGGPPEHWSYNYNTVSTNTAVLWAFDQNLLESDFSRRSWTRWVGYSNVITVHGAMGGPIQTTENLYYRGLHGDRTSAGGWNARNVTIVDWDPPHPDLPALAGTLRNTVTFDGFKAPDGSNWRTAVIHKQAVTLTGTQGVPNGNPNMQANRVRESSTVTGTPASTGAGGIRWTDTGYSYDNYGRRTVVNDWGDTATGDDDRCTTTSFTQNTGLWLIDFPTQSITTNCAQAIDAPGTLSGSRTFYDGSTTYGTIGTRGLPTTTQALANVVGVVRTWQQTGRGTFDAYGRSLDIFDALDQKTTTGYSPATGRPASVTTTVYPTPTTTWTSTTYLSLLRGRPVKMVDYNGKVSLAEYDASGRLTGVWLNHRATTLPTSVTPDKWFGYWLRGDGPNLIHTKVLGPDGQQIQSYQLLDGRMRPRQTHTASATGTGRAIADTTYNTIGTIDKTSAFYNSTGFTGFTGALVSFNDADVAAQQRYSYDNLGRQTVTMPWTMGSARGSTWNTTTVYDGDRQTKVTPPAGGTATTTIRDARGNTTALLQHQGGTPAGIATTTSYTYDRLGQLTAVTDPAGNQWIYTYNRLGRKTQTVDPDAGTYTTVYDAVGQVTSTTDGRGQQLFHTYDPLGRKTSQRADNAINGFLMADWTYDTIQKGQLTSTNRYFDNGTSTETYTTAIGSYDNAYRPLSTTHTIPGFGAGGAPLTYTVNSTYKHNGLPATTALPSVGGLPAEILTRTYTTEGQPDRITTDQSQGVYINDTTYHYDGIAYRRFLGNSGKQVRLTTDIDPANRRLTKQWISTENPATPGSFFVPYDYTYSYDPAGNITSIAGNLHGVAEQEECFSYDHLRRLRVAWTQTSGACTTPQRGGTLAPYWRTWNIDDIGNRTEQKDKDTVAGETTWTSTIGAAGSVKPHQVSAITATGPLAGTPTRNFTYDAAGNTLTRTSATGTAQTLSWDKEGRLCTLTEAGVTTTYIYDTAGNRLIARKPGKEILYLPDGTELEKTTGNPLAQRHYGFAVRDAAGLKWVTANHQGSSTVQLDPVTLATTRRLFMPYGEPRGSQPAGWLGTRGYVDGTKDDTGLTHLGARAYDPTTGRFTSIDPVMDLHDPQQWHAYTYGNGSPVTRSDPSGLKPTCDNDGAGCGGTSGNDPQDESTSAAGGEKDACYGGNRSASCAPESKTDPCVIAPNSPLCKVLKLIVDEIQANSYSSEIAHIRELLNDARTCGLLEMVGEGCNGLDEYLAAHGEIVGLFAPGMRWDHKDMIVAMWGGQTETVDPISGLTIFHDLFSNIHFGYVGREATLDHDQIHFADHKVAVLDGKFEQSDYISTEIGWNLQSRYRPEQITTEIIYKAIMEQRAAYEATGENKIRQ